MSFFLDQLKRLLTDERIKRNTTIVYVGNNAYIPLSSDRLARVEFTTLNVAEKYEAIKVTILSKHGGAIDSVTYRFKEYFSPMPIGGMWRQDYPKCLDL